ncbi:MAG TPA: CoA protein activase [Eubacteriaceae bacterium]|nr:CoA protein activase [Eubacteriaceae bacterium]
MIVTFPHMGNVYIGAKVLMEGLGVDIVIPPPSSDKTLEIGSTYSTEFICAPLKINIGNYIESIKKGADTVLITGSNGPCRFGFYGVIEQEILRDMGYDVEFIIFEAPEGDVGELIRRIQKATKTRNIGRIAKQIIKAQRAIITADRLERDMLNIEAREVKKGSIRMLRKIYKDEVEKVKGEKELMNLIKNTYNEMTKVQINKDHIPLKIGLIGEIYTLIEPYINFHVEEKLANLGVEVHRSLYIGDWLSEHLVYRPMGLTKEVKIRKAAKPYLDRCIGGHAWETIGYAAHYCQSGYDGIIQLLPFGCMPEIVAESILPTIQRDYNIPLMTLVLDELTGDTGYLTRLEAFVDMIERKRERRK